MDGEQRLILYLSLFAIILLTILGLVLLIALWPYRIIIAGVLTGLVALLLLLVIGIVINEQILRHKRVKWQSELPLDADGKPLYLHRDMKHYQEVPHYD